MADDLDAALLLSHQQHSWGDHDHGGFDSLADDLVMGLNREDVAEWYVCEKRRRGHDLLGCSVPTNTCNDEAGRVSGWWCMWTCAYCGEEYIRVKTREKRGGLVDREEVGGVLAVRHVALA